MAKRKPIARSKASLEESTVSDKLPVEKAFCLRYGSAIITAGERKRDTDTSRSACEYGTERMKRINRGFLYKFRDGDGQI